MTSILAQREWEVVKHVIAGRSNTEVAHLLFISENTVKKHLNSIYSKLEITKRIQLTQKILPNMLIP
ncbi:response regulator transcription factor [Brevibacillus choshinensis]|uniref:response regulator transcription factor n=1 Tax=Brevibacillus choshinensis TaxID=54911 RepID=UPI003D18C54E